MRDRFISRDKSTACAVRGTALLAAAFGCILLLLLIGATRNANFLSVGYLLTQLQVASFLALVATGMMMVILLGQIDLSVPWIITVGGMMSTAAVGWGPLGATFAIPIGVLCGLVFGIVALRRHARLQPLQRQGDLLADQLQRRQPISPISLFRGSGFHRRRFLVFRCRPL